MYIASSYLEKNKYWEENVIKYLFKNKDDSDGTFESKSKLKEQKHIEHIKNERKLLEIIDHPFIISLKFAFQTSAKLYLATEYCNGGEIFCHILKKGHLSESDVKFYFSQIVIAIEYLHSKKIIYRFY